MGRHSFIPPFRRPRLPVHQPVTIAEDLASGYGYRALVNGQNFEVLSQSGNDADQDADYEVGDHAVARRVEGGKQLFIPSPRRAIERIYYGIPKQAVAGVHEAELWSYDGVTHKLLYTTSSGWTDGAAFITCVFYLPATKLLYFVVFDQDVDVSILERNRLYKMNVTTEVVTLIGEIGDSDIDPGDPDYVIAPPFSDAAYFKSNAYLVQGGNPDDPIAAPPFKPRVIKFDPSAETSSTVFTHPDSPDAEQTMPSIAVQGSDAEILFAVYHNITDTGKIYSSTDGSSWSLLDTIDADAEILNMMTDRVTGRVYISVGSRGLVPFKSSIYFYDGISVQLDVDLSTIIAAWNGGPSLGARYLGNTRQDLWIIDSTTHGSDRESMFRNGGTWAVDSFDLGATDAYEGVNQAVACISSEVIWLSSQIIYRRAVTAGWGISKDYGYGFPNNAYRSNYCICRGRTSVLPHEQ